MCYKAPGPRCSSHAFDALKKATIGYKTALKTNDAEACMSAKDELTKAQDDFYMTPKGQDHLREKIARTGDADGELEYKLEFGVLAREEAIKMAKVKDSGDVNNHGSDKAEARQRRLDRKHAEKVEQEKEDLKAENAARKARGLTPVSKFRNLSLDSPTSGYASYDSSLIPQAPDLEKISSIADAVGNGANTPASLGESFNMTSRDGSYYANGAEYIGLVQKTESMDGGNEYELTQNGQAFRDSSPSERAVMLRELVNSTPLMEAYRESGNDRAKLEEFIRDSGYEETVAKRRASSMITWDKKLNRDSFVNEISDSSASVNKLSVKAAEKAQQARIARLTKTVNVKDYGTCMKCFNKLPATGRCDCED